MQIGYQILTSPVSRAWKILGVRSTMFIMRDVFIGRHRFNEFFEYSKLSKGTLTTRLEALVANQVLCKTSYNLKPLRYEYRLTLKGKALYSWALMIWQWESDWSNNQEVGLPIKLNHSCNGVHELVPDCICRKCKAPVNVNNVKVVRLRSDATELDFEQLHVSIGNQRKISVIKDLRKDNSLGHITDIIGDRWSNLIIAAGFLGLTKFEEFQVQLGIATNVLAARLKALTVLEVLDRKQYQSKPPRYEYRLSRKGKELYGQTMALRQWVLDYFPPLASDIQLIHMDCGEDLDTDVICRFCGECPQVGDVQFERQERG
jgi:DNA-binding HxlR family transcriptional regulator